MSKNTVRHFYSLFAPTNASSMAFQDVRVTLSRPPQSTSHLLLSLRLMKVGGPCVPTRRGRSWAQERVAVRETTQEERNLYYAVRDELDGGHDSIGLLWFVVFPPCPPAQGEMAHGAILIHLGHVTWEQPVQAGQEAQAIKTLRTRMRGEVDYRCDFHGLFRTTKSNDVEGSTNDVPTPPVKPPVRMPRKKPKPKPTKRQSRTKLG